MGCGCWFAGDSVVGVEGEVSNDFGLVELSLLALLLANAANNFLNSSSACCSSRDKILDCAVSGSGVAAGEDDLSF